MYEACKLNCVLPHVLLARGGAIELGGAGGCAQELKSLVVGWLRGEWLVISYYRFRKKMSDVVVQSFNGLGCVGCRPPVLSCLYSQGSMLQGTSTQA